MRRWLWTLALMACTSSTGGDPPSPDAGDGAGAGTGGGAPGGAPSGGDLPGGGVAGGGEAAGGGATTGGASGGGDTPPGGAGGGGRPPPVDGPTWHSGVRDLVLKNCGECHREGGIGPFRLDEYTLAQPMAGVSLDAIEDGRMPPWHASEDCRPYRDVRRLSDADRETFRAWVEAGAPEGTAAGPVEPWTPPVRGLPDARILTASAPYTPPADDPDAFRCFLMTERFERDAWLTASMVEPGFDPIVHHVLAFVVSAPERAELEALDARDAAPGFPCGGVQRGGPAGWFVPGADPVVLDEGQGIPVPAGGGLMLNIHYNLLSVAPQPDETRFHVRLTETPPATEAVTVGLAENDFLVPAGEKDVVVERTFRVPAAGGAQPWTLSQVAGHMHLIGSAIRVDVVRANGAEECLLDIPDWDYNWQTFYRLPVGENEVLQPGDALRVRCTYDNSVENQPVFNGERLEPRDVTWGEGGTLDEMCLAYVTRLSTPGAVAPPSPPGGACGAEVQACRATCDDASTFECLFDCTTQDTQCGDCVVGAFFGMGGCARGACGRQVAAVSACYGACRAGAADGAGVAECMAVECADGLEALVRCMEPVLTSGACDDALASCGE